MADTLVWVWFGLCCTPGSDTGKKLLDAFGTVEAIYRAPEEELRRHVSPKRADFRRLCQKELAGAKRVMDYCATSGVGILTYDDVHFPHSLKELKCPPMLLYYKGRLPDFSALLTIAVVGTRRLSRYGKKMAFHLSHDLARTGVLVVSGLAAGIDGVAHAGAIHSGGQTVAVLGCGIDVVYPKAHATLMQRVAECGAVLTEYPPGTPPEPRHFPIRNRLISGLATGVLVVEGQPGSGSMITARHAKEQGKLLYTVPGPVDEPNGQGPALLLKQGAKAVSCAEDILDDFACAAAAKSLLYQLVGTRQFYINEVLRQLRVSADTDPVASPEGSPARKETTAGRAAGRDRPASTPPSGAVLCEPAEPEAQQNTPLRLDAKALSVYKKIPVDESCLPDELADETLSTADVLRALTVLEVSCLIRRLPSGRVIRQNAALDAL
ncbi:MAG: DNA-processing protein DprA [Eubacteriales bacterium]